MRNNMGILMIFLIPLILMCTNQKQQEQLSEEPESEPMPSSAGHALANVSPESRSNYYTSLPDMTINESKQYIATIYTNKGDIQLELNPTYAPLHVNNFVFLAKQGFYDGLTFHRYEPGFVIQGGDPLGVGTGGPGYRIPAEIGLPHEKGAVAMARQPDNVNPQKLSSGSQFYITLEATPFLDGNYSVFGKVVDGFDVVKKIRQGDVMTGITIEEQ